MKRTLIATVVGNTYEWTVELPEGVPELVIGAARKGFQEFLQDASSTTKGTDADKTAACAKRAAAIQAGEYQPGKGGAGRGPSLDKDAEALHRWAEANGHKGKKGDLNIRLVAMVAALLVNAGMAKDEALAAAPSKVPALIEKIKATEQYKAIRQSLEKANIGGLFGGITL